MQAGAAELPRLVPREDAVRVVLVAVELRPETAEQLDLLVERLRLVARPGHPWSQVVDARVDSLLEKRRVLGVVAPDHETLGLDSVRRGRHTPASACSGSAGAPQRPRTLMIEWGSTPSKCLT